MKAVEFVTEKNWSGKYKSSINCSHPRGFSQKAHCAGRKKSNESVETEAVCPDCGLCESHGMGAVHLEEACWAGYRKDGMKTMFGKRYPNCVKKKKKTESVDQQIAAPGTCARTRAVECSCEGVNQLTESKETVTAVCVLEHSDKVKGTILFKQRPDGPTFIVGRITGLTPGQHGFHIHEFGDLSGGCETAGKHYNPDGEDHGDLSQGHVGDLGNITADSRGRANFSIVAKRVDLSGDRSVVGRAVVVHENPDDLGQGGDEESLKTGNAGERLACGVITLRQTATENNNIDEGKRVPRKAGQPANSKKHSDLYTDENPKGTITGLKFATPDDAKASVTKIRNSGRSHAHKIQAAVAMEQRAKAAGKSEAASVYRRYINANKKTESVEQELEIIKEDLRKWFKDKWVRFGPDGKIRGDCARGSSKEGKPKCLPKSKAQSLGKKGRAKAAARKRRQDPNADRKGKAINVKTK